MFPICRCLTTLAYITHIMVEYTENQNLKPLILQSELQVSDDLFCNLKEEIYWVRSQ